MKEIKQTPVPLPVSKPRQKQKDTPVRPQLSQEIIDSDDESFHENEVKTSAKLKTTIAIHTPNGAVQKPKEKVKEKSGAKEKRIVETISRSIPAPKKPAPEPVAISSDSEQSEDSDGLNPTGNKKSKHVTSDSDSSSEGSSDESEVETAPQDHGTSTQQINTQRSQPQSHAIEFQPAQPYVPPKGFNPVSLNNRTMSKAERIFENLHHKQIWHITAPAGISLKNLSQLVMDKALDGQPVLTHKGTEYGFSQKERSEDLEREVLVPGTAGYKAVPTHISQTLHLQAVVRLPALSEKQADVNTGSEAAASITRSTIRTPRAQVKGLKMRFLPSGFGGDAAGTIGDSDDEMVVPIGTAGLGMPNGLHHPLARKEKRKHADLTGTESAEAPAKKSKSQPRSTEAIKTKEVRRAKKEKKRAQNASSAKP